MNIKCIYLTFCIFFICAIDKAHSENIVGTYLSHNITVTVTKAEEAWRVKCIPKDKQLETRISLWLTKFNGDYEMSGNLYHCSHMDNVTQNVYELSINTNISLGCELRSEPAIFDGKCLRFDSVTWGSAAMCFDLSQPYIAIDNPVRHPECKFIGRKYKKVK